MSFKSFAFAAAFLLSFSVAKSATLILHTNTHTGAFTVLDDKTSWKFSGFTGAKPTDAHDVTGTDRLGNYTGIVFKWNQDGPLTGEIRNYTDRRTVLFLLTCNSARATPPIAFPTLSTPSKLHPFGYGHKDDAFAPPSFKGGMTGSPWLLFDDSARAAIISPASNFMIADLLRNEDGDLASGWELTLTNLPDGFTQQTLLVVGDSIHSTWDSWGHAMTDLSGKKRPANDADVELAKFGYWTDNGSHYYYNYDKEKGYGQTLVDVADAYRKLNVPLAYMQLDSWWYIKSSTSYDGKPGIAQKNKKFPPSTWNCYGGLTEYVAHPDVFPDGLASIQHKLNMPLITHNRWVDVNSPYRQKYKISGVAAIDPKWWDDITTYLKSSGVDIYEQDWLNEIYTYSPEFSSTTTAGDAFMDNMARACKERGMNMQYCMELPCHYMQGSKYDNLTTVRVAGDRFERGKYTAALYNSQLASALGEWPWVDTFKSSETPNMIFATLTGGMVGVGDSIDQIDTKNIGMVMRADGVIVKPDTSLVPVDQIYVAEASGKYPPMIAAAYTDHGPHRTAYVFCYPRTADRTTFGFRQEQFGIHSDVWIYEPATGNGESLSRGMNREFAGHFAEKDFKKAWSYFIVAPVTASGIAIVGDVGKFATAGKQRIASIEEKPDGVTVTATFAATETSFTLLGFAASEPKITAVASSVEDFKFNPQTSQFTVVVKPAAGTTSATVQITKS